MLTSRTADGELLGPGQTLVCLGDSVTIAPAGYVTTVSQTLALKFPASPPSVLNAGAGCDTAGHMLARFERDVLARKPHWVTIMAGVDDTVHELQTARQTVNRAQSETSADQFGIAIEQMVRMARAADVRIALCTPNHVEDYWIGDERLTNRSLRAKTTRLHRIAAQEELLLIPTGEVLLTAARAAAERNQPLCLTDDGLHPNAMGHALLALAFLAAFDYPLDLSRLA